MNSFRQIDSQQIDMRVENLRIDGRTATAQLARRDTLITAGRRQVQNSTQTLRFEKTDGRLDHRRVNGLGLDRLPHFSGRIDARRDCRRGVHAARRREPCRTRRSRTTSR